MDAPLEVVKTARPHTAIGREPLVDLSQSLRADAVHPALPIGSDVHETRVPQDRQVLRHCGLRDPERPDQIPHWPLSVAQEVEDAAPVELREDVEHRGHPMSIAR